MIQCLDCNAYVDPFYVLEFFISKLDGYYSEIERVHEKYVGKVEEYNEIASKTIRHRFKIRAFKHLEENYFYGLLPQCPICGEYFDPIDIKNSANRKVVESKKVKKNKEE